MRILYFFVAVVMLLFQICPGYAQGPPPDLDDTLACRAKGQSYCIFGPCPTTFSVSGNCHGGMNCCTKTLA
ncbi:gallinacin-10-like [Podarcis muralis]